MPSHLLSAFIGMMPAMLAEQTIAMADALALMSEYTDKDSRAKLINRLTALVRGKRPNGRGYSGDDNPNNYPGQKLYGADAVRSWMQLKGGFAPGQIED